MTTRGRAKRRLGTAKADFVIRPIRNPTHPDYPDHPLHCFPDARLLCESSRQKHFQICFAVFQTHGCFMKVVAQKHFRIVLGADAYQRIQIHFAVFQTHGCFAKVFAQKMLPDCPRRGFLCWMWDGRVGGASDGKIHPLPGEIRDERAVGGVFSWFPRIGRRIGPGRRLGRRLRFRTSPRNSSIRDGKPQCTCRGNHKPQATVGKSPPLLRRRSRHR